MMNALTTEFDYARPVNASRTLLSAFRTRLSDFAGIEVKSNRDAMVCHRLASRVAATGLQSLDQYLKLILSEPLWAAEFRNAVEMMTTNTTFFFREAAHFDFLANTIVPELAQEAGLNDFRLKLWSAAASEGAEAYTAAMVLSELQARFPRMEYSIIGTDLSEAMVHKARLAIYRKTRTNEIPTALRRKYLLQGLDPEVADQVRFSPEIRRHVRFAQMNLMDRHYPIVGGVDVAFLRNVLIYFSPEDQSAVIDRVVSRVRSGGYLIVGMSESMTVNHPDLVQVEPSIFRKL
ncbi:CheR family methyltransferase [Donghicola mangrovi]|uniref:Chemotaxis protein methyltransferase n=1 Tax=Donghicola mangrovi TaxID=2729614 RepID=A0A850Q5C4_9RHOB|nr:CheR family methyltransferase [Donghicola mangrovi]NVO24316.1 chemotaxis protein CheR [Donghicola mangrovi]